MSDTDPMTNLPALCDALDGGTAAVGAQV